MESSTKRSRNDEKDNRQGWSNVHADILSIIKEKLCIVDQFRFSVVCRSWHSVPPCVTSADELPWVLGLKSKIVRGRRLGLQAFYLYDPSTKKEHVLGLELKPNELSDCSIQVYASKHRWVFLAAAPPTNGRVSKLFLYHAFTKKIIDLPDTKEANTKFSKGTFSTIPTRSDCAFYVMDEYILCTYRNGDAAWQTHKFATGMLKLEAVYDLIYRDGILYCLYQFGCLWGFDIVRGDWREILVDTGLIRNLVEAQPEWRYRPYKMVESLNGELLLVYSSTTPCTSYYIFKLDWSQLRWIKEVALGDCLILIGHTTKLVSTSGEIKSLAGFICNHCTSGSYLQSFDKPYGFRRSRLLALKYFLTLPHRCTRVWV